MLCESESVIFKDFNSGEQEDVPTENGKSLVYHVYVDKILQC